MQKKLLALLCSGSGSEFSPALAGFCSGRENDAIFCTGRRGGEPRTVAVTDDSCDMPGAGNLFPGTTEASRFYDSVAGICRVLFFHDFSSGDDFLIFSKTDGLLYAGTDFISGAGNSFQTDAAQGQADRLQAGGCLTDPKGVNEEKAAAHFTVFGNVLPRGLYAAVLS